jgi:UDP-N-acetylglucosamine acyltransferase
VRGLNNAKAISEIEANMQATPERDEILTFIKSSDRGIMKGYISK